MRSPVRRRRTTLLAAGAAVAALGLAGAPSAGAGPGGLSAGPSGDPGATAIAQIAALEKVKASLTPAQRKLDSQLARAVRGTTDASVLAAVPRLRSSVPSGKSALVDVDVAATVSGALLDRLAGVGARVVYASKSVGSVRAAVPLSALETVAGWADVQAVRQAARAITANEAPVAPLTKQQRTARLEAGLERALATSGAASGPVVSEGDRTHAADTARATTHVSGVGVKVCVLSDGVDSLAASQVAGELPAVDVLPGQAGSGDEGTAMLEIVHDLAPGASLGFATAFISDASFADNIRALRAAAHCTVIVDDVIYFNEPPFQDGPIAQAVNAVTTSGALYFSSAGNEGNVLDGTSGTYEHQFVASPEGIGKFKGAAHDFKPGPETQILDPFSPASSGTPTLLYWADPLGAAADDYDLYAVDGAGNVLAASNDVQNGTQDPIEGFYLPSGTDVGVAVVKYAGADRFLHLQSYRGRIATNDTGLTPYSTNGATHGHSSAVRAFSVAAAPAAGPLPFDLEPGDPPNPSGPYPGVFTSAQRPERFTSDGPRRIFFAPDGSPAPQVRQKPEITAADGVSTSLPDFTPFFGTSAAAPHAAAIAALVLSGNPGAGLTTVRRAFYTTALDLRPPGVDNRTGHGILRADKVLRYTGATAQPLVRPGEPRITSTSDGDLFLEPGESGTISVPATNIGDNVATSVGLRVTSSAPSVGVTPTTRTIGTLAKGATRSASFTVSIAASWPLGKPVPLTIRASFVGALSPTSELVSLPTGQPGPVSTFAYAGPPVPIPDADPAGASVSIPVAGVGRPSSLTFSVDGSRCTTDEGATTVGIDHTYVADLVGTLTSPSGATATIFSRGGGSGNNLCQAVFDDAATTPFDQATSDQAPFTRPWQPTSPLAALLGASADGTWRFSVVDVAGSDTGSIRAVSLHIAGYVRN